METPDSAISLPNIYETIWEMIQKFIKAVCIFFLVFDWSCHSKNNHGAKQESNKGKRQEVISRDLRERLKSYDTLVNEQVYQRMKAEFEKMRDLAELEFSNDSTFNIKKVDMYELDQGYSFYNIEGNFSPSNLKFNFMGITQGNRMSDFSFTADLEHIEIFPRTYVIDDWVIVYGNIMHYGFENSDEDSVVLSLIQASTR